MSDEKTRIAPIWQALIDMAREKGLFHLYEVPVEPVSAELMEPVSEGFLESEALKRKSTRPDEADAVRILTDLVFIGFGVILCPDKVCAILKKEAERRPGNADSVPLDVCGICGIRMEDVWYADTLEYMEEAAGMALEMAYGMNYRAITPKMYRKSSFDERFLACGMAMYLFGTSLAADWYDLGRRLRERYPYGFGDE